MKSQPTVIIEKGNDAGQSFALDVPATIGRAPTCSVVLKDADCSRSHCVIEFDAGEYTLRDTKSANGTFLNGTRISSVALRPNDIIQVGGTSLRFTLGPPVTSAAGPQVLAVAKPSLGEPPFHLVTSRSSSEALVQALAKYKVLYQVTALVGQARRLSELYPLVLERLLDVFNADEAALHLGATAETAQTVASRARPGVSASPLVSTTVLRRVYQGEAVLVLDAALDDRLFGAESVMGKALRSLLCAPLSHHGQVLGALQLESTRRTGAFDDNDLQLFAAIGQQVAASVASLSAAQDRDEALARTVWRRSLSPEATERQLATGLLGPGLHRRLVTLAVDLSRLREALRAGAPEVVLAALNRSLVPVVDAVFAHGGSLVRLDGRGLVAVWGALEVKHDDPKRAVLAALAAQRGFLAAATATGLPEALRRLSVGLALGPGVVGTLGVAARSDLTAVGGPVDEAEALAGQAGGALLASHALRAELGADVLVAPHPAGFVVRSVVD